MRVINPQLRPELRKEGAGAAVPDPCKTRVNGCPDEGSYAGASPEPDRRLTLKEQLELAEGRARSGEQDDFSAMEWPADGQDPMYEQAVGGETFNLVVEVRLTKHSIGGARGRRIAADVVQALLDKSVADHAVSMHAQGQHPKVAGFTVRLP